MPSIPISIIKNNVKKISGSLNIKLKVMFDVYTWIKKHFIGGRFVLHPLDGQTFFFVIEHFTMINRVKLFLFCHQTLPRNVSLVVGP